MHGVTSGTLLSPCTSMGLFSTLNHLSLHMSDRYRDSGFKVWDISAASGQSVSRSCQEEALSLTNRIYQRPSTEEQCLKVKEKPVVEELHRLFTKCKYSLKLQ